MTFETRLITAEDTRALRHLVLWPHMPNPESCVIAIDHRDDARHVGAFLDSKLVGVCSLFAMETPKLPDTGQYRMRVMATHPDVRGMGAGKAVVEAALALVRDLEKKVLWCDAREVALGFYSHMGFSQIDEWYNVPKIGPHKLMFYRF